MIVNVGTNDPHGWAKFPRSAIAFEHVKEVARRDLAFKKIVEDHIRNGVCDEAGKVLMRFDCGQWVRL